MKVIFYFLFIINILFANTSVLKIAITTDMIPYSYVDENNEPNGMLVDYWKLWSKKTNTKIEFVPSTWTKTLTNLISLLPALLLTACNSTEPPENKLMNHDKTETLPTSEQVQLMAQIQILQAQLMDTSSLQPELASALQEVKALRTQLLFAEQQLIESEAQLEFEAQQLTEVPTELYEQIKILNQHNQELQNKEDRSLKA